jgi:hypothetical protein
MNQQHPISEDDLDDDGEHDPDACQKCIEQGGTVRNDCRCGECCQRLIIEVTARDAAREPLIKLLGDKLRSFDGTFPPDDEADWLLNRMEGGGCAFFSRDAVGNGVCAIHDTRPTACRVFDCDADMARIRGILDAAH